MLNALINNRLGTTGFADSARLGRALLRPRIEFSRRGFVHRLARRIYLYFVIAVGPLSNSRLPIHRTAYAVPRLRRNSGVGVNNAEPVNRSSYPGATGQLLG